MTDRHQRQRELVDVEQLRAAKVTVVGCGSLGSHVALGLARIGVGSLVLYDDDHVSEVNLPSQHFRLVDVGRPKAEALRDALDQVAEIDVEARPVRCESGPIECATVVMAVDSLSARRRIWEALRGQQVALVVDGRAAGNVGRVLAVPMADIAARRRFAASLTGDAFEAPCGGKTVWPTVASVSALMVKAVASFISGQRPLDDVTVDLELGLMIGGGS